MCETHNLLSMGDFSFRSEPHPHHLCRSASHGVGTISSARRCTLRAGHDRVIPGTDTSRPRSPNDRCSCPRGTRRPVSRCSSLQRTIHRILGKKGTSPACACRAQKHHLDIRQERWGSKIDRIESEQAAFYGTGPGIGGGKNGRN